MLAYYLAARKVSPSRKFESLSFRVSIYVPGISVVIVGDAAVRSAG